MWYGKYQVVVCDRQESGLLSFDPLLFLCVLTLRTMPVSARMVTDMPMTTSVALIDTCSKGRGPALRNSFQRPDLVGVESAVDIWPLVSDDLTNHPS